MAALAVSFAPRAEPHGGLVEHAFTPGTPRGLAAIAFPSASAPLSHGESSLEDDILGRVDPT
jgi:hypothetical protein